MISNSYPNNINGNSGIFVHEQVKALNKKYNCEIEIVNPIPKGFFMTFKDNKSIPNRLTIDGMNIHYLKYRFYPSRYGYSISINNYKNVVLKNTINIIEHFKPDLIHTHWATPSGYAGIFLAKKYQLPVVCTLRGSDIYKYPYKGFGSMTMTKKVMERADKIITVSNALKQEAEKIMLQT